MVERSNKKLNASSGSFEFVLKKETKLTFYQIQDIRLDLYMKLVSPLSLAICMTSIGIFAGNLLPFVTSVTKFQSDTPIDLLDFLSILLFSLSIGISIVTGCIAFGKMKTAKSMLKEFEEYKIEG